MNPVEATDDPKDVDGSLGQSARLVSEMDVLIVRGRALLRDGDRALVKSAALSRAGTLGGVLYATPSHTVIWEREWVSLARSIASRDQRALQELYGRVRGPVTMLIKRIVGDEEGVDQLPIAVLHDVWQRAGGYNAASDSTVVAWVMNIARAMALSRGHGKDAHFTADATFAIDTNSKSGWRDTAWEEVAPGISVNLLATDEERHMVSMLVRLVPNGEYPAHTHSGVEELHLLEGELWIDDRKLYPGDYNRCEPGTGDKRVWSETGCMCVLVTSTDDRLR